MAKLKELVSTVARVLGDPEPSVNVRAMELRKAGLIRSTGRGLNAADMTAKDATSLLVSCLCGGYATETAETTAHVLSALPTDDVTRWKELKDCNGLYTSLLAAKDTFGGTLEVLINHLVHFDWPTHYNKPVGRIALHVSKHPVTYNLGIVFFTKGSILLPFYFEATTKGRELYRDEYLRRRSKVLPEHGGEVFSDDAVLDIDAIDSQWGYKIADIKVGSRALRELASCLRGDDAGLSSRG